MEIAIVIVFSSNETADELFVFKITTMCNFGSYGRRYYKSFPC